jgi:hypothetical protein
VVETDDEVLEGSGSGRVLWVVERDDEVLEGSGSGSAENVANAV